MASETKSDLPWDRPRFRNWIAVVKVNALIHQRLGGALAALGLRIAQFDILANLMHEPGMTQQRLAEKIFVGRSNLSMALPDLEAIDWVRRAGDEGDRRVRRLYLTEEGARITRLALAEECAILDEMMAILTDEECDRIGEYMRRLADRLKAASPPKPGA